MAQVFKRKWTAKDGSEQTSKFYYCRFQAGGKDYLRSTGKTKRADALAEMRRIMDGSKTGADSEQRFRDLQRSISELSESEQDKACKDYARRLLHGIGEKLLLAETWETWLKHPNTGNPSPKTLTGYKGQWERFEKWAKKQGIQYLHETTPAHAEKYTADLRGSGISPRTFNAHTKQLQSMFKVLRLPAGIEVNPFDGIRKQAAATESRRNLTTEELQTVCASAKGVLRYLFALGLYTGMRLGDCVCLGWDAVDFKAGIITVMPMKTRRKKKVIRIPLHPVLAGLLFELREEETGDYLFPDERDWYLQDPARLSKRIQKFFNDCGIQTQKEGTGRDAHKKAVEAWEKGGKRGPKPVYQRAVVEVGFHSLRHSFVSLCAANRVPQVAVMELVGHGSPAMNRLYSHAGDELKAQAVAALPTVSFESEE